MEVKINNKEMELVKVFLVLASGRLYAGKPISVPINKRVR
jgi:hypothetical protein